MGKAIIIYPNKMLESILLGLWNGHAPLVVTGSDFMLNGVELDLTGAKAVHGFREEWRNSFCVVVQHPNIPTVQEGELLPVLVVNTSFKPITVNETENGEGADDERQDKGHRPDTED